MLHVLLSVAGASLLGSLHCAGMCGGFVAFYAGGDGSSKQMNWAHATYSLGRLLTYSLVGLAAGALGSIADVASTTLGLGKVAAVVAGSVMLVWGSALLLGALGVRLPSVKLLRRLPDGMGRRLGRVMDRARSQPPTLRAFILGISTTLLPCGWLYAFAVAAAGTASPTWGALVMAAFWSGTLPVMLGLGVGMKHLGARLRRHLPTLSALVLIVVGAASVLGRLRMDEMVRDATQSLDQRAKTLGASADLPTGAPCCAHEQ